jgi:hypothetical protein
MKLNAFSRRRPVWKPQFSRKRDKQKANKMEQWSRIHSVGESLLRSHNAIGKESNRKRIPSEKALFEAAIPSEAKARMHQQEKEQVEERVEI